MTHSFQCLWKIILHQLRYTKCFIKVCLCLVCEIFCTFIQRHKDISEEIVLITGGGRGIGRQIALELTNYSPKHIILWGRNESWLERTHGEVIARGVPCTYYICDVSSKDQIYSTAGLVRRDLGDVSILVNNAGTVHGQHVKDVSEEDFEYSLRVNTLAHIWTIKAFLPSMISTNHGHIVFMSSTLGLVSLPGTADYATSKFATTGFMESLVWELQDYKGIKITTIYPYQVDNDMFAGCRVRFPRIFPKLTEEKVTKATVSAVLNNQKSVILPWYFNFIVFLKSILPVACLYPSFKFLGLHNMMNPLENKKRH